MSRTLNSIRNIKYSIVGQVAILLANFITRMIFVNVLGAEYLGLNGLFSNVLSLLSLAELGFGSAIVYSMYEPLAKQDYKKLRGLMTMYKKAYYSIGIIILLLGAALTPFLGFFIKDIPDIDNLSFIYLLYVINSSSTYFFSYKRTFLIADQKKYVDSLYHYAFYLLRSILQIVILLVTKSFILYFLIQIIVTFFENVTISKKIDNLYPYLNNQKKVELKKSEKRKIIKNIKAMAFHKIGAVLVIGTDNLIIAKFVGLIQVGIYSNYILIIQSLNQIFNILYISITSSIGNLGVVESHEKNGFIFRCVDLLTFWIYGFSAICILILINPFIELWIGNNYLFSGQTVLLIVTSFYLTGRRKSVLTFKDALGLFWYDRFKPLFEAGINLVASVFLVRYFGINGVIFGTILSTMLTCFWIEPYVLYKYGLKSSTKEYFVNYFLFTLILIFASIGTLYMTSFVNGNSLWDFVIKFLLCLTIPNLIFSVAFRKNDEFKYLLKLMKNLLVSII